jgi:hypothetical protein
MGFPRLLAGVNPSYDCDAGERTFRPLGQAAAYGATPTLPDAPAKVS